MFHFQAHPHPGLAIEIVSVRVDESDAAPVQVPTTNIDHRKTTDHQNVEGPERLLQHRHRQENTKRNVTETSPKRH